MPRWCGLFGVLLLALPACGPRAARGASEPPELLSLSEARALEIIGEILAEASVARGPSYSIAIAPQTQLEVDVRLASSRFGVEWISPQDRADLGAALPEPASGGQLRIVPGHGEDASAQVLALEHTSYRYANEREAVQRGVPGALEAEGRLRRDVRDFLEYVRGQGGP
jgi:hypothetical protein